MTARRLRLGCILAITARFLLQRDDEAERAENRGFRGGLLDKTAITAAVCK